MKKLVRVLSVLTLTLCLGLALTACAKEEGKYVYENEGMSITIELKDGKFTQTMDFGAGEDPISVSGTYKIKGDKITFTVGSSSTEGTIKKGKSIVGNMGGGEITLTYKK
ncbi:MAG: hypothetical protein K2M95_02925 [Clostridiales bacterium]|nr:hypothetical protein [Clostridiales bacterium]